MVIHGFALEKQHPWEKRVKSSKKIASRKQSFVLSAVFIAGRRRVFGRNGDHRLRCEDLYL